MLLLVFLVFFVLYAFGIINLRALLGAALLLFWIKVRGRPKLVAA
jgi:hypothetical protein